MIRRISARIPNQLKRKIRIRGREASLRISNLLGRGPSPAGDDGPIVSIASYPPRVRKAYLAIESILRGRVIPAEIYLWFAAEEMTPEQLPSELRRLKHRGVRICFADRNFRSGNKLVHTLAIHPGRTIVVADDDVLYPEGWLEDLLAANRESPRDIICYRAHYIGVHESGDLVPYAETKDTGIGGDRPSTRLLATGVSGVLYPPGALDDRFDDHELFMDLCPTADDIWFKAMSLLAGTKTRRVRPYDMHFNTVRGTQDSSLMDINIESGRNDRSLEAVVERFNLRPALLEDR